MQAWKCGMHKCDSELKGRPDVWCTQLTAFLTADFDLTVPQNAEGIAQNEPPQWGQLWLPCKAVPTSSTAGRDTGISYGCCLLCCVAQCHSAKCLSTGSCTSASSFQTRLVKVSAGKVMTVPRESQLHNTLATSIHSPNSTNTTHSYAYTCMFDTLTQRHHTIRMYLPSLSSSSYSSWRSGTQ